MLLDVIRRFLSRHGIPPSTLVAAVSGGIDSTALLVLLTELRADGYAVVAAHVNHHLRGTESDEDEAFVRTLCESLGVELRVSDGTIAPRRLRAHGIEAAAREVRYELLREVRERTGARWVATAHQKNDQAETVLMRLRHGSGLEGLRGIQPLRDDGVVRPLLAVRRGQLEEYLAERGIAARHDRSNDDLRFERNRVRALLRAASSPTGAPSDFVDLLAGLASQAQALRPAIERSIEAAEAAHVLEAAGVVRFVGWPDEPWLRRAMLRRAIRRLDPTARDVSRADLERLTAGAGELRRVSVTKELELVADDATVILRPRRRPVAAPFEARLTPDTPVVLEGGTTITIRPVRCADSDALRSRARDARRTGLTAAAQVFELPAGGAPEFIVRPRRPGDRFQPLGLDVPKRLKDLLIDRRIAAELRDHLPLLVWNGEIVWVAGVEVSERFKVTSPAGVFYEVRMEVSGAGDDDNHAHVHR